MEPIFIDLETRSACDLKTRGSWQYAKDETTRLLTVAWRTDGQDHVWLPGLCDPPPSGLTDLHLPSVRVHVGERVPADLCRVAHRPWVGHNSWTFDRLVWNQCTEGFEHVKWLDTYPLALASGLPGGLGKIGEFLWGEGKYEAGSQALKKAMRCEGLDDCEPENVPIGILMLVAKYNVQDVRLTEALWNSLPPMQEPDVLAAHHAINARGCKIDRKFVEALIDLSDQAKGHAIEQINILTGGALPDTAAVQSRARVLKWLDSMGYKFHSLKKDIVAKFLKDNAHGAAEPEESGADEDDRAPDNLPLVLKVLELRMQALRATGGKLATALASLDDDDRARGMFVYWGAHTGRWSGRRIQLHNLTRPKEGIDTWALCDLYERTGKLDYSTIHDMLPIGMKAADGTDLYPFLSVDDAAASLLRSIIVDDVLLTADLANIETRMVAWMAGEQWLLDAFWKGECAYLKMAEAIVGKTRDQWPVYPDPKTGKPLPLKKHPYRQIVGKVPMLAAVYQIGGAKIEMYAAQFGHSLRSFGTSGKEVVIAFRKAHPAIAGAIAGEYNGTPYFRGGLWCQLNNAALMAVSTGQTCYAGRCVWTRESGCLICTLPSGRRLTYRDAKIEPVQPTWAVGSDKWVDAVTYWSPKYQKRTSLYGGMLTENIVQAASRDILAYSMVELERNDLPVVLHCHDEAGSSGPPERYDDFMRIMSTPPPWLTDFPLDVEGGYAKRYAKSAPPGFKEQVWRNGARHA